MPRSIASEGGPGRSTTKSEYFRGPYLCTKSWRVFSRDIKWLKYPHMKMFSSAARFNGESALHSLTRGSVGISGVVRYDGQSSSYYCTTEYQVHVSIVSGPYPSYGTVPVSYRIVKTPSCRIPLSGTFQVKTHLISNHGCTSLSKIHGTVQTVQLFNCHNFQVT